MFGPFTLDEVAFAGREHFDPTFVAGYDRKQGHPDPTEDLDALSTLGLGHTAEVVDLGAGTGQFSLAAARRFGRVTAVDVSPLMLGVLAELAEDAGMSNLECVEAGFLTYEPVRGPVDGVFTRNALHHLPDFWKAVALRRVSEFMRPGGVLRVRDLIYDFELSEAEHVLGQWLDGAVDDANLGYTRDEFAAHIRTEQSTFRWLFEPMLIAAGFEILTTEFRRGVYGAYTCRRI